MEKFKDTIVVSRIISDVMKAKGIGMFRTFRVGDLLWGYEDPLLKELKQFVSDDHFGLFYKVSSIKPLTLNTKAESFCSACASDMNDSNHVSCL